MDIEALNDRFAIDGHVAFEAGPGGLAVARVANGLAEATVAINGAHVMSFQPRGCEPVLWMSASSRFEAGAPIRGGIPVCWPWFGPHPTDADKPAHGFARTSTWTVMETGTGDGGETVVRLGLVDNDRTRAMWDHAFALELIVTVAARLGVVLAVGNPGESPFTCGGALHSYFAVSDVADVAVAGLDGCTYIDKLDGAAEKVQDGPVTISAETDRVYVDTTADCVIDDRGLARRIRIAKRGSGTTVVWNPWSAKAARMPDFGDDEFPAMLCIETANAAADTVTVPPGGHHFLQTVISVETD